MPSYSCFSICSAGPEAPRAGCSPPLAPGFDPASAVPVGVAAGPVTASVLASAKPGSELSSSSNMRAIGMPSPVTHGRRRSLGSAYVASDSAASESATTPSRRRAWRVGASVPSLPSTSSTIELKPPSELEVDIGYNVLGRDQHQPAADHGQQRPLDWSG